MRGLGIKPDEICWADPKKIKDAVFIGKDVFRDTGKVLSEDWDLKRKSFEDTKVFRAFRDRFINGKEWKETAFYEEQIRKIMSGTVRWGCNTQSEFDDRMKQVDELFYKIKNNGYKTQKELSLTEEPYHTGLHELTIAIGRNGELLFTEGRHRLSIAKLLNISRIPARITVRHEKWIDFRKEILLWCKENKGGLYQPITHPDLAGIPSAHGEKRFRMIRDNLPGKKGKLLDIGANWGYFCHKFEDEGFECIAVEPDKRNLYFLKRLRDAENRSFKIINKSIFEYREENQFSVVLALNIFYHFLKTEELYKRLIKFLNWLETDVMFFQSHLHERLHDAYRNFNEEEFVHFVLKNSGLTTAKLIGRAEDGRALFMLTRKPLLYSE